MGRPASSKGGVAGTASPPPSDLWEGSVHSSIRPPDSPRTAAAEPPASTDWPPPPPLAPAAQPPLAGQPAAGGSEVAAEGRSPLHMAAWQGRIGDLLRLLQQEGIAVDARDAKGCTALCVRRGRAGGGASAACVQSPYALWLAVSFKCCIARVVVPAVCEMARQGCQ